MRSKSAVTEVERFVCRIVEVHGVKGYFLISTEYLL